MIQQFKRKGASECDPTSKAMHTKTNDELVAMIYDGNDKDDEALQQLIHNLMDRTEPGKVSAVYQQRSAKRGRDRKDHCGIYQSPAGFAELPSTCCSIMYPPSRLIW